MENDREPMDSLTEGTASLLRYNDRRRQLDLCDRGAQFSKVCNQSPNQLNHSIDRSIVRLFNMTTGNKF